MSQHKIIIKDKILADRRRWLSLLAKSGALAACVTEMGDSVHNTPDAGPIRVATGISGFKGGRRNIDQDHYTIFPDIVRLLGLEAAMNKIIFNYSGGEVVF